MECVICMEEQPLKNFITKHKPCQHFIEICKKCKILLNECPYCMKKWCKRNNDVC
jgi:hypothetical protein